MAFESTPDDLIRHAVAALERRAQWTATLEKSK
jgi:hypothetical protein